MGLLAGASVAIILWLTTRIEKRHGQRAAEIKMAAAFDPDDAILILPLAASLNWLEPTLAAASVGAPLFAVWAYRYCWRELLTEPADTG
jgi:hypothetical protein